MITKTLVTALLVSLGSASHASASIFGRHCRSSCQYYYGPANYVWPYRSQCCEHTYTVMVPETHVITVPDTSLQGKLEQLGEEVKRLKARLKLLDGLEQ